MSSTALKGIPAVRRQACADSPAVLSEVLDDDVNMAVWQRRLPAHIENFAALLLSLNQPLAESLTLEISADDRPPALQGFASAYADLDGYEGFVGDVEWLVGAYACLLGSKRIGLRLRVLDKAMCPRFHVDHVPVRLVTTYAGSASQWLREGAMDRSQLGNQQAEPQDAISVRQMGTGDVALLKGERWMGNEGHGLVHRSPPLQGTERRLILTLDWLA